MAKNLNLGIFFMISRSNISKITNFSEKQVSFKLKVIFSTNFRRKTKKIVRAVFEKYIKVSDFGLIWRLFREYLQIKDFFQKSGSVSFPPLQSLNIMRKISRKLLRAFTEKIALPTNQLLPTTPILQYLIDAGPISIYSIHQTSKTSSERLMYVQFTSCVYGEQCYEVTTLLWRCTKNIREPKLSNILCYTSYFGFRHFRLKSSEKGRK